MNPKEKLQKVLPFTLDLRSLILGLIIFGSIGWLYFEVLGLRSEVTQLTIKLELYSKDPSALIQPATTTPANPIAAVVPTPKEEVPSVPVKRISKNWKSEMIRQLKEINQGREPKRVIYQKNSVVLLDATLVNEDPFFELLGFLMDEEKFLRIELPKKIYETPLPKGLMSYGVSPNSIRSASIPSIKVIVNDIE